MCLSVPCKVVEIEGKWAKVEGVASVCGSQESGVRSQEEKPKAPNPELPTPDAQLFAQGPSLHRLHIYRVYIGLLKDVRVGDYLMVHGDMAIHKVGSDDAVAMLSLL